MLEDYERYFQEFVQLFSQFRDRLRDLYMIELICDGHSWASSAGVPRCQRREFNKPILPGGLL